jgi:hypothetical protein
MNDEVQVVTIEREGIPFSWLVIVSDDGKQKISLEIDGVKEARRIADLLNVSLAGVEIENIE